MQGIRTHFGLKKGKAQKKWDKRPLLPEPLDVMSNLRSTLAFYFDPVSDKKQRLKGTHVFINREDEGSKIDHLYVPFAYVIQGMHVVNELGLGWGKEYGNKPRAHTIRKRGSDYFEEKFEKCTRLVKVEIIEEDEMLEGVMEEKRPTFNKFGKEEWDDL